MNIINADPDLLHTEATREEPSGCHRIASSEADAVKLYTYSSAHYYSITISKLY